MAARHAKLHLNRGFVGSTLEIDGQSPKGVRGLTLRTAVNELPVLTLDLLVHEVEIDGQVVVIVPDKTRDTLIALGWTPPADEID